MKDLAYYNGKISSIDEMMIPINDRCVYFGDGIYEATTAQNRKIRFLDEHVARFIETAGLLEINLPYSSSDLHELFYSLIEKMGDEEVFIYWQASRGTARRSHEFPENAKANLLVMMWPKIVKPASAELKLCTIEDQRHQFCNIKSLNVIPNVLATQRATEKGCDEAILHRGDVVTECAHSNISILKNGVLITHPADNHILPGVARAHLIAHCKKMGIPVQERFYSLAELFDADEIITSSSGRPVGAACEIDGKPCGGKDQKTAQRLFDAIYEEYSACIR